MCIAGQNDATMSCCYSTCCLVIEYALGIGNYNNPYHLISAFSSLFLSLVTGLPSEPSFIFNERNVIGSSLYELEYQITGSNCSQIPLEDELGCARLCEAVSISHSGRATSDAMAGNSSSTTGLSLGCLGTPGTFLPLLGFLFGNVDLAILNALQMRYHLSLPKSTPLERFSS
ncbi:hypothetical protein BDB01DRAFT_839878 [Pilobolus umbonatus]|nr:hypothetical protein BDB01DRAFT_839878 [Pilobolus umbonatus]